MFLPKPVSSQLTGFLIDEISCTLNASFSIHFFNFEYCLKTRNMKQPITPKEGIKQIQTNFWFALILPLVVFTLAHFIVSLFQGGIASEQAKFSNAIFIGLIGSSILVITSTIWLGRSRVKKIDKAAPILKKLMDYRDINLWTYIGLDICLLLSAVYYLLEDNTQILFLSISLIILLITLFPTKERIAHDLELNKKERFEIG